eukprot:TRINITY_DN75144_c0_g1_i1.p1 TRINITY_DN75144_c0_g1~~TRINITY_DN75144_c0_g1_i1.p1  ORF type:complete len:488 (+),score=98.01 TRINITY_DN75144_c0_g1_i1:104-1567(+)
MSAHAQVPYMTLSVESHSRPASERAHDDPEVGAKACSNMQWLTPALLFLAACFMQNAAVYWGTATYIRHADEVDALAERVGAPLLQDWELDDPMARLLQSSRLAESLEGLWTPEMWVDAVTGLLVVAWACWVIHFQDLRLWTRLLLCATLLAVVNGLLAAATVLPDAEGWAACQKRLGSDGLKYFRDFSSNQVSWLQSFQDIFVLTVRSLWVPGHASPHRVCGGGAFSSCSSLCALFCASLYSAIHDALCEFRHERKASMLGLVGLMLLFTAAAEITLEVWCRRHYSLNVIIAVPLALLIHGSPAGALAAECWCEDAAASNSNLQQQLVSYREPSADSSLAAVLQSDLAKVSVVPCCIPFCSFGGDYFLRDEPYESSSSEIRKNEASLQQRRLQELAASLQQSRRQCEEAEASIKREEEASAARKKEALAAAHSRAAEAFLRKEKQQKADQEKEITPLRQQLEAEEQALAKLRRDTATKSKGRHASR